MNNLEMIGIFGSGKIINNYELIIMSWERSSTGKAVLDTAVLDELCGITKIRPLLRKAFSDRKNTTDLGLLYN
jgi:hypothetical protein